MERPRQFRVIIEALPAHCQGLDSGVREPAPTARRHPRRNAMVRTGVRRRVAPQYFFCESESVELSVRICRSKTSVNSLSDCFKTALQIHPDGL